MPSNVAIPLLVSVASSAANDILLSVTVVVIPSPPAKVNVSPVLKLSVVVPSEIVNAPEATAAQLVFPEPSTFRYCPLEPAVAGSVKTTSPTRAAGDFNNTE